MSLSLQGRIGRLRYLAFMWPTVALSGVAIATAIVAPLFKQPPGIGMIVLIILVGILWFWMSLRSMALRLHDINRSAKWLLALFVLQGLCAAFGGGPKMMAICGGLFWVLGLLLIVLPGSEGDNDFGPPPGDNTTLVKVGAALFLAVIVLAVVGNIKYMQYVRSGKIQHTLTSASTVSTPLFLTRSDFVGTWEGQKISLRVEKDGTGDLSRYDGNFRRALGPLRVLSGNRISIGFGLDPMVLNVTVPPHVEGGVEKMTLDGIEMVRTQ
jgi:uncharacterized membrane protein YhaH (DUF805 family)